MILEIVNQYESIVNSLGELITVSGYRNDYIAKKMGLKTANFSVKKQRATWTISEVQRLLTIINNEDVQNYLDAQAIKMSKTGRAVSTAEFEKAMAW